MNIPNINQEPLETILPKIKNQYPNAVITKALLGPQILRVPYENFQFAITKTKTGFKLDVNPPTVLTVVGMIGFAVVFSVIYSIVLKKGTLIVGGAVPALVAFLIIKVIFKSKKKKQIEHFAKNLIEIIK